jgi:polyhydroxyalkanoate synthase
MNDLANGRVEINDRVIDLANVEVPVLVVAGTNDVLAPADAVVAVEGLLTGAPEVHVHREPGGHLGVLTGRGAKDSTWRDLDDFLAAHDVPAEMVRRAAREAREHEAAAA